MIKRAMQQTIRERENVRGGEGKLSFHDFLSKEEAFGTGHLFSRAIIPAGASIGEHRHDGEFEVYYILSGTAEVNDNGTLAELGPGDTHLCANGESHAIRNTGTADLVVLMLILFENASRA